MSVTVKPSVGAGGQHPLLPSCRAQHRHGRCRGTCVQRRPAAITIASIATITITTIPTTTIQVGVFYQRLTNASNKGAVILNSTTAVICAGNPEKAAREHNSLA